MVCIIEMSRRLMVSCTCLILVSGLTGAAGWLTASPPQPEDGLPVPPFPARITEGSVYETCLATLAEDPTGAVAMAETWQADGGGDGAVHCRGLALIAPAKPAAGAELLLEQLVQQSVAAPLARVSVLGQAVQARLMIAQADGAPGRRGSR